MKLSLIKKRALDAGKGNWGILIAAFIIYGIINGAAGYTFIASLILYGPITTGYNALYLHRIQNRPPDIAVMFSGFSNFVNTMLLGLVNKLFIALWYLLFVIPGIIKSLSYSMSYFIMAEHPEIDQSEARRRSIAMMKGNKFRLFCLYLSFFGWIILSIFTLGILLIWVYPYIMLSTAAFYEDIKGKDPSINSENAEFANGFDAAEFMNHVNEEIKNEETDKN